MTNIERYAGIITDNIEFSQSLEPLDPMRPSVPKPTEWHNAKSVAGAVIEAFVDDLAKEMCPFCRDGKSLHEFPGGVAHVSSTRCSIRPLRFACLAADMRRAGKKILEGA